MFVTGLAQGAFLLLALIATFALLVPLFVSLLNRRRRNAGWIFLATVVVALALTGEYSRNGWPWPTSSGTIDVAIGEPMAQTVARSSYPFPKSAGRDGIFNTNDVVDLRFRVGDGVIDFPKVGGMNSATMIIGLDVDRRRVMSTSFADQHRPLRLDEALKRAEAVEAQLGRLGFQRSQPSFITSERADGRSGQKADDWADARHLLAGDAAILSMWLYSMEAHGVTYSAALRNMARHGSSIYDHNFGREWLLSISIDEVWDPAGFESNSTQAEN